MLVGVTGQEQVWLFTRWALAQVAADPEVAGRLGGARVLELLGPGQAPVPGIEATSVATFMAVEELRRAAGSQALGSLQWVLYDPEAWTFTPVAEQRDPAAACLQAAGAARAGGLRVMIAPALSRTTVLAPESKVPRWRRYLDLGLAGAAAAADAVELQAQSLERDTATYTEFVRAATEQARAVSPRIPVLAGLSTNPPGAPVTARQLIAAVDATRDIVDGYWLNIPRPGPHCPTCNPPRPDLGMEVLRTFL